MTENTVFLWAFLMAADLPSMILLILLTSQVNSEVYNDLAMASLASNA